MRKLVLSSLLMILLLIFGCTSQQNSVCFDKTCFEVELAITSEERAQGLMFREGLEDDEGMLFIFDELGTHKFWMKNTLVNLDIIWINDKMEVVHINKNTPICKEDPCPTYGPDEKVKYVLEINSGLSDKLNIFVGDFIDIKLVQ